MKKIFSLVCSLVLVLGANASSPAQLAATAKKAAPAQVEQVQVQLEESQLAVLDIDGTQLEPMQATNSNISAKALKVNQPNILAPVVRDNQAKKVQVSAKRSAATAKKVVNDVFDVTIGDYSATDYETDMYYVLTDTATGNIFYFDIYYTDSIVLGHTYTLADMETSYSCVKIGSDYIGYTSASFTITKDASNLTHIVATAVTTDANTYNLTFDETAFVPSGVQIQVDGTDLKDQYYSSYGIYVYLADWNEYTVQLAFNVTSEKATYTNEDFNADYSMFYTGEGDQIAMKQLASDITITTTDSSKVLSGSVYAKNGDEYILNLVYLEPDVEEISVSVADAALTKKTMFFQVDGKDSKEEYEVMLYVVSKSLEGDFTIADLDVYSSGLKEFSSKKWFDIDSCTINSAIIGSNTVLMQGLLHTSNKDLGRKIDATFVLTARIDKNGELMNYYGGIIVPAQGDTVTFLRETTNTTFYKSSSQTKLSYQSGKATMVVSNDTVYYWKNPLSTYNVSPAYWVKGIKDIATNTITFPADQIIQVFNGGISGTMSWVLFDSNQGQFSPAPAYAPSFVFDIDADTLTMQGTEATVGTTSSYFPGIVAGSYGFQGYGDCGVKLYKEQPITERDTVDIVSTTFSYNTNYITSNKIVIFYATDVEGYDLFRVTSANATAAEGTYKWKDGNINENNSYFQVTGVTTKNYFQDGEFTMKIAEDGDTLTGWMIGEDEKYYRLNWTKKKKWDVRDTVYLSAQGVTIQETTDQQAGTHTGWLYYNTTTPGYETVLLQSVGEPKYGTFSYADKTLGSNFYNLMPTEGKNQQFQSGEITVGEVGDSIVLDGLCIGEDEKAYVLHFAQANKVINYDTDAPFAADYAFNEMDASIEDGVITIYASNDSTAIGLELYADPAATTIPAGVFVIDSTKAAGTALQSVGVSGGYLTKCYAGNLAATGGIQDCFFMVDGTITLSYDEYGKLKVEVDALNSYDQPVIITVKYTKIDAKDTVEVRDVDFFIGEEYKDLYGVIYYEILDGIRIVGDLWAYTDTVFGDFKDAIDFGDCVLYDAAFNKLSILDVDSFTVLADGKNMTLTAKVLGSDTILYDIVATGYYGALPLDAEEDYEGSFDYEITTFVQATKTQVMINTGSAAMQDTAVLVINAKLNKSGLLAEGEYTEIMASTGITAEGQITPSFTGNTEGNWYIQSGKLTVNADQSMVFVGVNSYDKNVTINIAAPKPVALKEMNANETIVKFFDGNKIIIRKGNKQYNVLGAEL